MKNKLFCVLTLFINIISIPHYYATSSDSRHFSDLMKLIASIKKNDFADLEEIAVFNLGFQPYQLRYLEKQAKVRVVQLENVNPDALTLFKSGRRKITGWFAWKPIAIKQALDMYPYVLYLDADMLVLKPLDNLFRHVEQNGYFLIDAECYIHDRVTKNVVENIINKKTSEQAAKILDEQAPMSCAGIQGLSRVMLQDYVLPVYEHAKEISLFEDDGSAKLGLGHARHDQTIFSIYSCLLRLKLQPPGSWMSLSFDDKEDKIHAHWDKKQLTKDSAIFY